MLSATFNPSETFIEWVKQKGRNLRIIKLDNRPVPLEYYLYNNDNYESNTSNNNNNNEIIIANNRFVTKTFSLTISLLIFIFFLYILLY